MISGVEVDLGSAAASRYDVIDPTITLFIDDKAGNVACWKYPCINSELGEVKRSVIGNGNVVGNAVTKRKRITDFAAGERHTTNNRPVIVVRRKIEWII